MWRIPNDKKCIQVQIWTFTTSEKSSEMDLHWYDIITTEERVCATCFHLFFVDLRSSWTCVIRERRIKPCKPWVKLIVKSNHTAVRFWPQLQKNAFINIQAQHEIFSLLQLLSVPKLTETRTAAHQWLRNIVLYRGKRRSASDQKTLLALHNPLVDDPPVIRLTAQTQENSRSERKIHRRRTREE